MALSFGVFGDLFLFNDRFWTQESTSTSTRPLWCETPSFDSLCARGYGRLALSIASRIVCGATCARAERRPAATNGGRDDILAFNLFHVVRIVTSPMQPTRSAVALQRHNEFDPRMYDAGSYST